MTSERLNRVGLRILLAADDVTSQHGLRRVIRRDCPSVELHVVDTADACEVALGAYSFDCAVIDFHLAAAGGGRLLRNCGSIRGGCPVVVVSSDPDHHVAVDAFRCLGAVDFLLVAEAMTDDALWRSISQAVSDARRRTAERRRAERRERYLVKLAESDPLTGLANRRYIDRCWQQGRWTGDRRGGLACVMLDLDRFKQINDTHGHSAGDLVLRAVAEVIALEASAADVVARWGGEEFLVLRPSMQISEAWAWAETLRRRVSALSIESRGGEQVKPTVSVGVTCVDAERFCQTTIDHADRAMYLAKQTGRDRVCTWTMARMASMADVIAGRMDIADDPAARYRALVAAAAPMLGPTQRAYLTNHAERVAAMAEVLARIMGVDDAVRGAAQLAGLLHDAGKLAAPESLLSKPRRLNLTEHRLIACHTEVGAALAERLGAEPAVVEAVRHQHVRFDRQAAGADESPASIVAGIVNVADAIVAMMDASPYRRAMPVTEALAELRRHSGGQYDPRAVAAAHFIDGARLAAAA